MLLYIGSVELKKKLLKGFGELPERSVSGLSNRNVIYHGEDNAWTLYALQLL